MQSVLVALALAPLACGFAPRAFSPLPRTHTRVAAGASELTMRTPLMAGNWKMNPTTLAEAKELATEVSKFDTSASDCAICVPFPFLSAVGEILEGSGVSLGAQDLYTEQKGAFTGAVSPGMLKSIPGVEYVLAGHSERRVLFGDDDSVINVKVRTILDAGLKPILCIGETKEEYDKGLNKEVCAIQLAKGLSGVSAEEMAKIVIAYEPVWAIGTGLTCPPDVAQEVHAFIRGWFDTSYSAKVADDVIIQYGGSVTPETVDELMAMADIDGALVGGASLLPDKFSRIVGFESVSA